MINIQQKIRENEILIMSVIVVIFVSILTLGTTGLRTIITIILLFFVPAYLIIKNLSLETDEKVFFSFFISLGLFAIFVYPVARLVGSLKVALVSTWIVLCLIGVLISYIKSNLKKRNIN